MKRGNGSRGCSGGSYRPTSGDTDELLTQLVLNSVTMLAILEDVVDGLDRVEQQLAKVTGESLADDDDDHLDYDDN